jgi:hypothetical protein
MGCGGAIGWWRRLFALGSQGRGFSHPPFPLTHNGHTGKDETRVKETTTTKNTTKPIGHLPFKQWGTIGRESSLLIFCILP